VFCLCGCAGARYRVCDEDIEYAGGDRCTLRAIPFGSSDVKALLIFFAAEFDTTQSYPSPHSFSSVKGCSQTLLTAERCNGTASTINTRKISGFSVWFGMVVDWVFFVADFCLRMV
jgi:hypothetical protein